MGREDGGQEEAQGPVWQRGQLLHCVQGDGQALRWAQCASDDDEGGALCILIQDEVAWAGEGWGKVGEACGAVEQVIRSPNCSQR